MMRNVEELCNHKILFPKICDVKVANIFSATTLTSRIQGAKPQNVSVEKLSVLVDDFQLFK